MHMTDVAVTTIDHNAQSPSASITPDTEGLFLDCCRQIVVAPIHNSLPRFYRQIRSTTTKTKRIIKNFYIV